MAIYKFKKWVILPAYTEIVISADNDEVLSVRRNYGQNDPMKKKIPHFVVGQAQIHRL